MKTQVAIIGAGPSGLLLGQLLAGETVENMTRFGGNGGWGTAVSLHGGDQAVLQRKHHRGQGNRRRNPVKQIPRRIPRA